MVVGVAANGKYRFDQLDEPSPPFVYLAWAQWAPTSPMILVRVDSRSTTSAGAIRRTFARLFPSGVLKGPMWLDDYTSVALFPVRLGASVLSALGGLAMGLAALGLYAIMAFRVAQRTREVGVRIAIGASRVRIIGMFILQGAKTAATGLLVGLPLGLAVQKVFKAMIPAFDPGGVVVYAWAVGFLLCLTLLASGLAARRASRILPADALRAE